MSRRLPCPFCGQRETTESGADIRCRWCGATVSAEWWDARSGVRLRVVAEEPRRELGVESFVRAVELLAAGYARIGEGMAAIGHGMAGVGRVR